MEKAIEVVNLHKYFGKVKALNGLSFMVNPGEIYGLIGPNGAGKTTTLRILATLIRPTSGSARIFGLNVEREANKVRRIIGYLPEEAGAYRNLSGTEYLEFIASFYFRDKREIKDAVYEAEEISGLGERLRDKIKTYSKGMIRRLLVARTLMIKPKLAILDEPTSGIDIIHAYHIRRVIKNYVKDYKVTVLLSSHNMFEVEFLCTRIAFINKGRILVEGSPEEIKTRYEARDLEEAFMEVARSA